MATDEIRVRRATLDDYEAVLAINGNVYDGLDYLPTLYHQFIQSKLHVVYVAETRDSKLVGLVNYRLNSDGKTASWMSARNNKNYLGKGMLRMICRQLHMDYPNVSHLIFDGLIQPSTQNVPKKYKLLYQWNVLLTLISSNNVQKFKASTELRSAAVHLTHSEVVAFATSGYCEKFLETFSTDFIPAADSPWTPVRLCEGDLKELMVRTNTLVTFAGDGEAGSVEPDDDLNLSLVVSNSTVKPTEWQRDIRALSFSSSMLLKSKRNGGNVITDIFFFGKDLADLLDHCRCHVRHTLSCSGTSDVYFALSFPAEIDRAAVENQLLLTWAGLEIKDNREAYLVCADYHDVS